MGLSPDHDLWLRSSRKSRSWTFLPGVCEPRFCGNETVDEKLREQALRFHRSWFAERFKHPAHAAHHAKRRTPDSGGRSYVSCGNLPWHHPGRGEQMATGRDHGTENASIQTGGTEPI